MQQFDKDMQSAYRDLFLQAREFILGFDAVIETQKPRITTYSDKNGGLCHLRTMPQGIDFGFLKGAQMEDIHERLTGKGKALRVLSMKTFEPDIAGYYLKQAISINADYRKT